MAQSAVIEVIYSEISFYENEVGRGNKYHLLANTGQSKFFNPRSKEINSLTSTPQGLANFKKTQEKYFRRVILKKIENKDTRSAISYQDTFALNFD